MSELWHYTSSGKPMEPVTTTELKQLIGCGFLRPGDLVWKAGMPEWTPASSVDGLFPGGAAIVDAYAAPTKFEPVGFRPAMSDALPEPIVDAPRRQRRSREDDSRRVVPKKSMSGLAIGLIIAGVAVAVLVCIGVGVYVANSGARETIAEYSVNLEHEQFTKREFLFRAGVLYEITVQSDQNTDVDLYINNVHDENVAKDTSFGPNSFLRWSPEVTGVYAVEIYNHDRFRQNRSRVKIRSVGKARNPVGNEMFPQMRQRGFVLLNDGPAILLPDPLADPFADPTIPRITTETPPIARGNSWERGVFFPVAKKVTVAVDSDNVANDIDLYVLDADGRRIAADEREFHTCRLCFMAEANMTYRFRVVNQHMLGDNDPSPSRCTLTYTKP